MTFSGCVEEPDGRCCIVLESDPAEASEVQVSEPELSCVHRNVSTCHYTYVTVFRPHQEEVCADTYTKTCSITFTKVPEVEVVRKCYRPLVTVCDDDAGDVGDDEEVCRTVQESVCTTRYLEPSHKAETRCEKVARELCGARLCGTREAEEEECHDKEVTSVRERPEEVCSLAPQRTCRHVTRLLPRLQPSHVCSVQPREVCHVTRVPRTRVQRPPVTKWCRAPESEDPGVTRDAGELLRRAKAFRGNSPQKQVRSRHQKTASLIGNSRVSTTTKKPTPEVDSKTMIAQKNSKPIRVRGPGALNFGIIAPPPPPPLKAPTSPTVSSQRTAKTSTQSPSSISRPVFDDILGEVHGADFPQARSKTNYNQNKHGVEHLDNAITDRGKDKESGDNVGRDTSEGDNLSPANNAPGDTERSREIDHILSEQLPSSSQFPPPQETFNQVISEKTTTSPRSSSAGVTRTTARNHKTRKSYLPTNKSNKKKKKGYLPQKASHVPRKNKSYLSPPGSQKSNAGYLPGSGLSLPGQARSPKLVLLSLPPLSPPQQDSSADNHDDFTPPREDIGHNDGVRADTNVNNNNINDDTRITPRDPNGHRDSGGGKQKKHKNRKSYLPVPSSKQKKKTSSASRIPDAKDDERDPDRARDDASSKRNNAKKKPHKNIQSPHRNRKTKSRKSQKLKEESNLPKKNKKTDTEESPFYSLPDSIFDELPEYFRPLPRGLAALIGLTQENQEKRKKY